MWHHLVFRMVYCGFFSNHVHQQCGTPNAINLPFADRLYPEKWWFWWFWRSFSWPAHGWYFASAPDWRKWLVSSRPKNSFQWIGLRETNTGKTHDLHGKIYENRWFPVSSLEPIHWYFRHIVKNTHLVDSMGLAIRHVAAHFPLNNPKDKAQVWTDGIPLAIGHWRCLVFSIGHIPYMAYMVYLGQTYIPSMPLAKDGLTGSHLLHSSLLMEIWRPGGGGFPVRRGWSSSENMWKMGLFTLW